MGVLVALAAVAILISVSSAFDWKLFSLHWLEDWQAWVDSFAQNLGTEMVGAFATFLLIEVLVENRRQRRASEAETDRDAALRKAELDVEKERLILQMGSPFNQLAVEAARQLRWRGWLKDGSLKGIYLMTANLQQARLLDANLQEARSAWVNLQKADLYKANLHEANLIEANLQAAFLVETNLQATNLREANLQEANLWKANLQEAILLKANLQGAQRVTCEQLAAAETLEGATLPDGFKLPGRTLVEHIKGKEEPDWRTPFEEWCNTVETDEKGFIIPAPLEDDDEYGLT